MFFFIIVLREGKLSVTVIGLGKLMKFFSMSINHDDTDVSGFEGILNYVPQKKRAINLMSFKFVRQMTRSCVADFASTPTCSSLGAQCDMIDATFESMVSRFFFAVAISVDSHNM